MLNRFKPKMFRPALLNTTADPLTFDGGPGSTPAPAGSVDDDLEPDMDEEKEEATEAAHKARHAKARHAKAEEAAKEAAEKAKHGHHSSHGKSRK